MRLQTFRPTALFLSFLLFPLTFIYLSPAYAVFGAYQGVVTAGLLAWSLVLLTALVAGRAFCAYLCPLGGLQMCLHGALQRPLVRARGLRLVKYAVWAAWVGLIVVFAVKTGGFSRFHLSEGIEGPPLYGPQAAVAFFGFAGLAAVSGLAFGRRGFCHHLCFFSPLNIIGSRAGRALRLPQLRLTVTDPGKCTECKRCNAACPMTLYVAAMVKRGVVSDLECITCGSCSASCQKGVIAYGVRPDP